MRNPFRDPMMRSHYEGLIRAYEAGNMISPGGRRVRSNGAATEFWRGYDGARPEAWDAASKKLLSYAYWCAGRDARKREAKLGKASSS